MYLGCEEICRRKVGIRMTKATKAKTGAQKLRDKRSRAGRPRKSGERYPSGDIKRPTFEMKRLVDDSHARPNTTAERDARIRSVVSAAWETVDPDRYGGKHLAGINCVYFINQVGTRIYKIGFSQDLKKRMVALTTGASMELNPVAWVSVSDASLLRDMEAAAHYTAGLLGEHLRGEWFKIEPAYISAIVTTLKYEFRGKIIGVAIDDFHDIHAPRQLVRDQDQARLSADGISA